MKSETPYIETNILLAVMNDDEDEAKRLLHELGGLRSLLELRAALTTARLLIDEVIQEKRKTEEITQ